ncbi:hypothetical protein LTR08_006881 [Meristemomyces frigidus]|nr:hypothetical protein LTR08_006881 [Meristemomyces frigidus]
MYHALHASGHASKYMIQDLLLPTSTAEQFINYVSQNLALWPLWLCPFTVHGNLPLHPNLPPQTHPSPSAPRTFINIGVWGPASPIYPRFVAQNRHLEHQVRQLGGIKWLYAHAYYTAAEFRAIYDGAWYDALRAKYRATHLPTVYDKVRVDLTTPGGVDDVTTTWGGWLRGKVWDVWPVSGLYGVWKTVYTGEYLLAK